MYPQNLHSAFMATTQEEVSIRSESRKFGFQSWQFKDLNSSFKSAQQDRFSKNQKKLIENRYQHQIHQWASDILHFSLGHQ